MSNTSRYRRVPQGSTLPGMPLEMDEEDESPRRRRGYEAPAGPWWRPRGAWGRVSLALGALTILGGLSMAAYALDKYLVHDARFRIAGTSQIQAAGLGEVSRAEILPVFGEDIGKNIFFVRLSERRKQLEQIPWIEHATVMRLLPDQLRVNVVERTPIAFVRSGQQIGLVDANGVLLSMPAAMMTKHHYSFPVVTGIDPGDPQASRKARMAVYQRLMNELDSAGQHYSEQISEIDLTDPEDARILMPEQGKDILAHFGDEQFLPRYQRYKAHIAEWRAQYPNLASVDLRYEQQVVLQMTPGAGSDVKTGDTEDAKPSPEVKANPETGGLKKQAKPKTKPLTKAQARAATRARIAARDKARAAAARHNHAANNRQGQ
jgi:cell division protein FtsQ